MYDVINLTIPEKKPDPSSNFSLNLFDESAEVEKPIDQFYTEAVFANGKESVMPIVETIKKIKDLLESQIAEQDKGIKNNKDADNKRKKGEPVTKTKVKYFDPKAFWKNQLFKQLEDEFSKVFGFRDVSIEPYIEKYNSKEKMFESRILNAEIYHADRFPIEGLVTDKGFYDKSKSVRMNVYLSLGLIRALSEEEIMAVMLHEFGHSIDPALVDIKYTEVNILSKYLTDRKHVINKNEKKFIEKHKNNFIFIFCIFGVLWVGTLISSIFNAIRDKILGKEKVQQKKLEKVRKMIEADKDKFTRQEFSEAFADNFARMYGFGPQLLNGLKKLDKESEKMINSRFKKERTRQDIIVMIVQDSINDVHKTNIHRARALIKEYKADIADPNTSAIVKKQLQEDLTELEKILDEYLTNFGEFQNRVNEIINEELSKIEVADEKKATTKKSKEETTPKEEKKEEPKKEEPITESKKAYEKMKKEIDAITSSERNEFYKLFGKSTACSLAKDKNGYYVRTHRARSKSYPEIKDIPKKDVEFVRSTS